MKTNAPSAQITGTEATDPVNPIRSEENFYDRLQRIWSKVLLLEEVGFIKDENDKFHYAYRLAEIELQKLCDAYASLQGRIQEPTAVS